MYMYIYMYIRSLRFVNIYRAFGAVFLVHVLHSSISCSGGKLALSLFSNTAFGLGVFVISDLEERQLGLQWNNVADPLTIDEPLNMGAVFGMMICDIILYMLIAW